jgi:hypothetical protein
LKNEFHDRLTDAFGIPEPVRKEEFFSRLDEAKKKRRLLPVILRVGSVAAAAAAAFTIWLSGRTTPDMVTDHHNDPGIISEFPTDTETTAAADEERPSEGSEKASDAPTEPGTDGSISTEIFTVPKTETPASGTLPSASQNVNTQTTAADQPAFSSPSPSEAGNSHADGTTDRRTISTGRVTTERAASVTTAVPTSQGNPQIRTKPAETAARTTPPVTTERIKPVDTPRTEAPTQRATRPPQPISDLPTIAPSDAPISDNPGTGEFPEPPAADSTYEQPTMESPTYLPPQPTQVVPTYPAFTPTDNIETPTINPANPVPTPGASETAKHLAGFYIPPNNAVQTPDEYYRLSELLNTNRTSRDRNNRSKTDFLDDMVYDHAFIGRVDDVFFIEDEYGRQQLVENITILDNLYGDGMQGDTCSIVSDACFINPSQMLLSDLNDIYYNSPDSEILSYFSGTPDTGLIYNGPDDIYIYDDKAISREPQKNDICLFLTFESYNGQLVYADHSSAGRFSVRGRSVQNDRYSDYRYNINEIIDYFDQKRSW